ncbi:MAG: RNA polymerase factor sigma-54 [Rhodospirillales bacterium]
MALNPRLDLRQSQQLVMTPQLQQAIKLLQFSHLELAAFVDGELEQNPLLERGEDRASDSLPESLDDLYGGPDEPSRDGEADYRAVDVSVGDSSALQGDKGLDVDRETWLAESGPGDLPEGGGNDGGGLGGLDGLTNWGGGGGGSFDGGEFGLEQTVSGDVSLRDHLLEQAAISLTTPAERLIVLHLIDMLDAAGYLQGDLIELADRLGCPLTAVEAVLDKLQGFDPPGVFARNLAECLALQLKDRNRYDPAIAALLDNLEMLAKRDLNGLMRVCGVGEEDIRDMVAEVRALNPKPALAFDHDVSQPVVPDVLMRPKPGGGWIVELNAETLPRVLINNTYHATISARARDKTERQYINECFQSANWLVKSLHQRATTILKVATEIVAQQEQFFLKGVQHLRPLVLRDIAEAIGMHESTVSRVTSNKFMATPRGIYELKYFFTTAIGSTSGGDAHSAESVRFRIKALIDAEPADKVLSDDKIVAILNQEGMDIARRTVAKYREALGIASSVQRRRQKMAAL